MKSMIAPSMMCVDFADTLSTLKTFERCGIEYLHIDVMDGNFVPNFSLSPDYCRSLKRATTIPLDIHLMITEPERKLDWFPMDNQDYISIHYEATNHPIRVLDAIRQRGAKPMIALNPSTPIDVLETMIDFIDAVLIMTVNPGFAGQKLIERTLSKIEQTRAFLDERGASHVQIEVDGNVSFQNAVRMKKAGADIFVAGTSSVFAPGAPLDQQIEKMRGCIE